MKKILHLSLAAAIAVSAADAVRASEPVGSTYITPMVHGQWHDDARFADDDLGYTLAIGRAMLENWNFELNLSQGTFDGPAGNDLEITAAGVNALRVFYRDARIAPYLLLGLGWTEQKTDAGNTDHDPYADTMAGVLATLRRSADGSASTSLRLELGARHTYIGDDTRLVDYRAGLGLQFAFGGSPARLPEPAPVPAAPSPADQDADGVADDADQCPDTRAGLRVDARGCELDSDGDGVVDTRDKCPGTSAGTKVDASGCEADSDEDGVLDGRDRCAETPKGDKVDAVGCSLTLRLEVLFETNSAELRPESSEELDRAAALLRDVPSITGVIEGHTDSNGSAEHNQRLSQRRALAVRDYLIAQGIDGSRLSARGLGESEPVADNSTAEGRAQNRRVVLKRTDQR